MDSIDELLRQQIAYYRARASEYDEWFLRQGDLAHGMPSWKSSLDPGTSAETLRAR